MAIDQQSTAPCPFLLLLVAFGALALLNGHLLSQEVVPTQELVFPHLVVGGPWETEITVIAQGAEDSAGLITFFGESGQPLAVRVNGAAPSSSVSYSLLNRSSKTFVLSLDGDDAKAGYAIVSQTDFENVNKGAIQGVLTFKFKPSGSLVSQVGVPPSEEIAMGHVPYDNTNGNQTGIAIASLSGAAIEFKRYNEAGTLLETKTLTYAAGEQRAFLVTDEFPDASNQRGFFTLRGDDGFYSIALNINNNQLSGTVVFAGVIEREIITTESLFGGSTEYTLHVVQEGRFLRGVLTYELFPDFVSNRIVNGFLVENGWFVGDNSFVELQLNIMSPLTNLFGEGPCAITQVFRATTADKDLISTISGSIQTVYGDNCSVLSNETFPNGTFQMFPLSSIQF